MNLIQRAKNIIITPKTEWGVIAGETTPAQELIVGYVLPLAAAAAIASFIGTAIFVGLLGSIVGARVGIGGALIGALIHVVMAVVSVFVIGFIVDALAPTFGGQKSMPQALKLMAYSYTPGWVFGLAAVIPFLGWIAAVIGGLYGIYVMYLGIPKLMKSPEEKSIPYLVVVILCAIVLYVVIGFITSVGMMGGMMGAGVLGRQSSTPDVAYDRDSRLGKLQEFGKKMEEAGKKMDAAQKSGDANKQMEAAMATLGTALSGGKGVEPLSIDQIKPFVPETFAGLPRTAQKAERSGVAGLMVAKAEATYDDSAGKRVHLEVVDTGGAAGLMGLASWMNVQSEREDENRSERTRKEGDRMIHEEVDKRGGRNKYGVVVGNRFMVSAEGNGVDIGALKSGVNSVDLGKLESTK